MRIRHVSWFLAALVTALLGPGCGKRLVTVKGVAALDGKPLEGALVTFTPLGGKGQSATGMTQPDGSFNLVTIPGNLTGEGAWPGEYKVTVERDEYPPPGTPGGPPYPEGITEDQDIVQWHAKLQAEQKKKPSPWAKVPAKYSKASTTPLQCKVPSDGPVRLDLTSSEGGS
jgi:hypothetical protein